MTNATLTYVDHSGETSRAGFYVEPLDGSNYAAVTTAIGDIQTVIDALSAGAPTQFSWTADNQLYPFTIPADVYAQREIKALVTYADTVTGLRYNMTIPVFGMAGVQQGTDVIDLTVQDWANFVIAFEASARSQAGNPVEVIGAVMVGRNS